MKIMIRCDMEGVTGITCFEQTEPGKKDYPFAQKMLMNDLNAVIAGLFECNEDIEIHLYDMHYYGQNVIKEQLDKRVNLISGKPIYTPYNAGGLDSSFDGLILVGFHSKAGTPGGLLAHSYELETNDIRVNGISMGEIGIEATIAGDFGVPVIMVTGDSKGMEEARAFLKGVETVSVKKSISLEEGRSFPPEETAKHIKDATRKSISEIENMKPFVITPPIEIKISLLPGIFRDKLKKYGENYFVSPEKLIFKGNSVIEVWSKYQETKERAK